VPGSELQDVCLASAETESTDPHPFYNVDQAAFESRDTTEYVTWRHVVINLTVSQSMLGDHLTEFGRVQDEEQRPKTRAVWHSVQNHGWTGDC